VPLNKSHIFIPKLVYNLDKPPVVTPFKPPIKRSNAPQRQFVPQKVSDSLTLYNSLSQPVNLSNLYKGSSAFLICGGPSFNKIDKSKLSNAGFVTMSVNNSVKNYRPNLWTCVDNPGNFIKSIWLDPKITKFAPINNINKTIFDNEKWQDTNVTLTDCPNTMFYERNGKFDPNTFLTENTFNWGNSRENGGNRSVMLVAIKLLYYMGIRNIYLLGVDFKMNSEYTYSFNQKRSDSSVKGNNSTYNELKKRFTKLRPIFEDAGLYVHNCNLESELKAFPFVKFEEAIASTKMLGLENERTEGLYDRKK